MAFTTAQAFAQMLTDITATEHQCTVMIPGRKSSVDARLAAAFPTTSDMPFFRGTLMGSAAKGTIIRPVDDIDVLAVFDPTKGVWPKYSNDSRAFIYRIRDAYNGTLIQQVGTRGQAIRVFYDTGGHVDIAPVFHKGDSVYHLPNGTGGWILTAPTIANEWLAKRNGELGNNLVPLIRLLKAWNRTHSKRFRSFHLETVAAHCFSSLGSNYRDALQKFFEWAPNHLRPNDPGGQSGDLSQYLSEAGRRELLQALASGAERSKRANEAEARGDHEEAKRLWRIVLGDNFPLA